MLAIRIYRRVYNIGYVEVLRTMGDNGRNIHVRGNSGSRTKRMKFMIVLKLLGNRRINRKNIRHKIWMIVYVKNIEYKWMHIILIDILNKITS